MIAALRRFYAEEIEAVANLSSQALVDALASVPREDFLGAGPWAVLSDASAAMSGDLRTRTTPDADPKRVYHNIGIAIDPSRLLFNGQPGTVATWLDALALARGHRVLHVGCGLGYYTALIAHVVGSDGRVMAFEVDEALASDARRNLARMSWVTVRHDDSSGPLDATFDAILVNAGMTHPLDTWLDALVPGGRMILPLTATMPASAGSPLGKGLVLAITNGDAAGWTARVVGFVAIYSAVGLRDDEKNARLGKALTAGPPAWQRIARLRRDAHEPASSCWLHDTTWCLSTV